MSEELNKGVGQETAAVHTGSDLLIEIGCEELPASYLAPYAEQLSNLLAAEFAKRDLAPGETTSAFTPRRIVFHCAQLADKQPVKREELRGPPTNVAFKDGAPTRAAEAFAEKAGVPLEKLQRRTVDGKEYLFAKVKRGGGTTASLLPEIIATAIRALRAPKTMRWEDKPTVFARPIRWIVALFGTRVLRVELDGLSAGRKTFGHRFLSPGAIPLASASLDEYRAKLRDAHVILDLSGREGEILRQLAEHGAVREKLDLGLVRTCANLVEWPSVVRGSFPSELLELPAPVLATSLKKHQKSFPAYDASGAITSGFLSVANNDLQDEQLIRRGYERVIVARLADAKFFWDEDRKKSLASRVDALKSVTFHEKLGSYHDKTARVEALVACLCEMAGNPDAASAATRAARLSRADLTTAMVFEFPELQGVMGRQYARVVDGEPDDVCVAIEEMYQPRGADDALPASLAGALLSIADKMDTLAGCCAVGLGPTSSADPYALRRQSLGVLRTIARHEFSFSLQALVDAALSPFNAPKAAEIARQVRTLLNGRLETVLKDMGVRYDLVNAVLAAGADNVARTVATARRLMSLLDAPEFKKACTVVERCHNITRDAKLADTVVDATLFAEPLEKALWSAWQTAQKQIAECSGRGDVAGAITCLAGPLYDSLHEYFDRVMVNVDDEQLRTNRQKMLRTIRDAAASSVADLSCVVFEGEAAGS